MSHTASQVSIVRTCSGCGSENQISAEQLTERGRCHRCKAPSKPLSEPVPVRDQETFKEIVQNAAVPVLTAFGTARSGACRMAAPDVHELAHAMAGRAIVMRVDIEKHPQLAYSFGVCSLPHFSILREGTVVSERAGAVGRWELRRWLDTYAGSESRQAMRQSAMGRVIGRLKDWIRQLTPIARPQAARPEF